MKKAATAGYGAEIVTCPAVDREKVSAELVEKFGYTLIHPYDNDHIIAGQGTAAWELFEEVGELDTLFVPVGGGGLISGSALATAVKSPNCRVVSVWNHRLATMPTVPGAIKKLSAWTVCPDTIADGLRTRFIGERNMAVMQEYRARYDHHRRRCHSGNARFLWTRMKIVVEPSSAAALAPLLTGQYQSNGQTGRCYSQWGQC